MPTSHIHRVQRVIELLEEYENGLNHMPWPSPDFSSADIYNTKLNVIQYMIYSIIHNPQTKSSSPTTASEAFCLHIRFYMNFK